MEISLDPTGPMAFGLRDLEVKIELSSEHASASVLLHPPHVEIRSGETAHPVAWRMTPTVCDPEDFAQDRFVAVRAPGVDRVDFGYFSEYGDLLQTDRSPRQRQGDVFESRIQQFADTVRTHPGGGIVATLWTDAGPVGATILSVQPRRLASDAHLREDLLVFSEIAAVDDLAVYVWSATAPWRAAEILPVVDGMASLPGYFIETGDLQCELFVDDPWVHIDPPNVPSDNAFRVEQLGWREDCPRAQVKLSRYLGTQCRAPIEVGPIPEVWTALARLHADGKLDRFAGLIELLAGEPRKALECLGNSTIPVGDKMAMLIRSELVNRDF